MIVLPRDCLEAETEQASGFPRGGKTGDCSMCSAISQWELVTDLGPIAPSRGLSLLCCKMG